MTRYLARIGGLCFTLLGCEGPLPAENPKTQVSERAEVMPILSDDAKARPAGTGAPVVPPAVAYENVGFETPESVLYDAERDVYIVTNVKGSPDGFDDNGFLSVLSPDGGVKELAWIRGGHNGVTLNAPKGCALFGGKLWVTDIDHLRRFDVKSGKMDKAIAVPGATFLNDVFVTKDGTVYFSDSGVKVGKDGFDRTGVDAVYKLVGDLPTAIAKSPELAQPNGVYADGEHVYFVTLSGNELRELDATGKELRRVVLPAGTLDGLVKLGPDDFLVSSWEQSVVFRGGFASGWRLAFGNQPAPADVGFDSKRRRVLIPHFVENSVHVMELEPTAVSSTPAPSSPAAASTAGSTPAASSSAASSTARAPRGAAPVAAPAKPSSAPAPSSAAPASSR